VTVFIYINTSKQVGDPEHIKVFADGNLFAENDPGSHRGTKVRRISLITRLE
jgi:hypothetical protein